MEITKGRLKKIIKEELNNISKISEVDISDDTQQKFRTVWATLDQNQKEEFKALIALSEMKVEV